IFLSRITTTMRAVSSSKRRSLIVLLMITGFVHVLFCLNKSYTLTYPSGWDYNGEKTYDKTIVDAQQYNAMIKQGRIDLDVEKHYFQSLPGWSINIVYVGYLITAILFVLQWRPTDNRKPSTV